MHSKDIIHRDLKPGNILIYSRTVDLHENRWYKLRICDLGASRTILAAALPTTRGLGTDHFAAPEILDCNDDRPYTKAVDLWGLGATIFTVLTKRYPYLIGFSRTHNDRTKAWREPLFKERSTELKDLVEGLLEKRVVNRFTCEQCFEHEWVVQQEEEESEGKEEEKDEEQDVESKKQKNKEEEEEKEAEKKGDEKKEEMLTLMQETLADVAIPCSIKLAAGQGLGLALALLLTSPIRAWLAV